LLSKNSREDEALVLLKDMLRDLHYKPKDRHIDKMRKAAEELLLEIDELGLALVAAANLLTEYAVTAEESGRYKNALALYQHALGLWPASGKARRGAMALCRKQGLQLPQGFAPTGTDSAYLELGELAPISTSLKEGELRINETKWGLPIYNNGTVYERGIWTPAPSRVAYNLRGAYRTFTVNILISAFKGSQQQIDILEKELVKPRSGTVRFTISGDGRKLFESDVISYSTGVRPVSVDVTGVKTLSLVVDEADGSDLLDFAVWADGRLYM
jgi:hypothetical protein